MELNGGHNFCSLSCQQRALAYKSTFAFYAYLSVSSPACFWDFVWSSSSNAGKVQLTLWWNETTPPVSSPFKMVTSRWTAGKFVFTLEYLSADIVRSFFRFYGTNAYWLQMTSDADMDLTFHDIAIANFKVVRTWAFNDVHSKPSSGPYFQV